MGWGHGTTPDGREVGYTVDAVCEQEGCEAKIDRGLSYCCGGMHGSVDEIPCRRYFCAEHLVHVVTENPEVQGSVCGKCAAWLDEACSECGEEFEGGGEYCPECVAQKARAW